MARDGEIKIHESTYSGFLNLFRYGAIAVAVIVVIVILLIAH